MKQANQTETKKKIILFVPFTSVLKNSYFSILLLATPFQSFDFVEFFAFLNDSYLPGFRHFDQVIGILLA